MMMNFIMRLSFNYLNPIHHLGERNYSFIFPLLTNLTVCLLSELFAYQIVKNPNIVGIYIIFINVVIIIYFSFREGIRGGIISSAITIAYYFYIIYTRHYSGQQLISGIETTIGFAFVYFFLSWIIGWLKQTIDTLIEQEADQRKRLEAIIQQLPVGVLITDSNGRLIQRNKKLDEILGVKMPIGFKFGKDTLKKEKIDGQIIRPNQSPIAQVLKSGKQIIAKQFFFERRDGKKLSLQVSSTPIHNKYRKIIAAASIVTDITQQKELDRQKDDFISMASHELKTPITSLKMFVDLQARKLQGVTAKEVKYFNDRIRDQANRLKELTNDLLDISRIQTGKLHFKIEEFNLAQLVYDTVEGLAGTTKNHKIILKSENNVSIHGDRYRIYQVLINLITNAIKYSPSGKKIVIEVKKVKRTVVVSVQDFGIGIRKEQQEKIFERLYQVTDPAEKTFPGLGLGLFISKEIIKRHNGTIWVKSIIGKGSTFYFSFPIQMKGKE
jgi:two-component system, OmpR family, phosphate regulon sensor histidine kinase PhoR